MTKLWQFIKSTGVMAVLAIVGFGLAIYLGFFYERRGEVAISLDGPARVFELLQPVGGLDISYAGENLRSSKKALWVVGATFRNVGNAEIRKGDYDESVPLGLQLSSGQLVDIPTLRASNGYLQENLRMRATEQKLLLTPVIFEPGDSARVTFLVLGAEDAKPNVTALGKIAGVHSISVSTENSAESAVPWWRQVAGASSWWIQALRMLFYPFCLIVSIALFAAIVIATTAPFESLSAKRARLNRQAKVEGFRPGEDVSKELRFLETLYVQGGDGVLQSAYRVIQAAKRRAELFPQLSKSLQQVDVTQVLKAMAPLMFGDHSLLNEFLDKGMIHIDGGTRPLAANLEQELLKLCEYLEVNPDKPPDSYGVEDRVGARMYAQMMRTP